LNYSALSLGELVTICAAEGRPEAWELLIQQTQPLVASVVLRIARRWGQNSPTTVEDLVQEVYLKLCANRRQLMRQFDVRHPDSFWGFLKVLSANLATDYFRSQLAQKRSTGASDAAIAGQVAALPIDPDRQVLLHQIDSILYSQLPQASRSRDRMVFRLYYRYGMTARAIAEIPAVGLNVKGVESLVLRMTQIVRTALTNQPATQPDAL
jgi:RNA polymerase sigma factor (sigma-70 family)